MHSAQRGIRFFTEDLPEFLPKLNAMLAPLVPQKATFTATGSFNADKDGGGSVDAKVDVDVTAIVKGAPADIGAGLKATYDNQGEAKLSLVIEFG